MVKETAGTSAGPVLVCLDGSPDSDAAAAQALEYARIRGLPMIAVHIYDAAIHESRFRQMEPGLPGKYQDKAGLKELRDSHGTLMSDGFSALSRGYMKQFLDAASRAGIEVEPVVREGRNYVGLLDIISSFDPSMIAMGAAGLGDLGDGVMGSTASRLLRAGRCDCFIGRASSPVDGPVLAAIDGSGDALAALETALIFAGIKGAGLDLIAAYDPELHQRVFKAMADAMPPEARAAVGLDKQQDLHESLIDDGLGTLYRTFLDEAVKLARAKGVEPAVHLVADKGYRGIARKADETSSSLICLGRFGHNRERESVIGAAAENVARLAPCHVLVKAPPDAVSPAEEAGADALPWDPEALDSLRKVPRFVRKMAKNSIENAARTEGSERVMPRHVEIVSGRFRGKKSENRDR